MSETQLRRCPACGATNRVPLDKIDRGLEPVCGRCNTPLLVSTKSVTVTDVTFAAEVERSPLPVLLDMWAVWCRPCQVVAPVITASVSSAALPHPCARTSPRASATTTAPASWVATVTGLTGLRPATRARPGVYR